MTLIEIAFFVVSAYVGVLSAKMAADKFGVVGGIVGFFLGFGTAICFWLALGKLLSLWHIWRPLRPICRNGKCNAKDYEIIKVSAKETIWVCKCGDKYVRKGRAFMSLNEDENFEPYMIYTGLFCRWRPDK